MPLDTTVISGTAYDANGQPKAGVKLFIKQIQQSGHVFPYRQQTVAISGTNGRFYRTDSRGKITTTIDFELVRNCNVLIEGPFFVGSTDFSGDGVWKAIPDAATATLASLGDSVTLTAQAQPLDADLSQIAALIPANDDFIQRKAGVWTNRTPAQVAADLPIGGGGTWGSITGTLSDQADLSTALGLKAPLASPTFTGTPVAPTAVAGTNTTQLATTAFVKGEIDVVKGGVSSAFDTLSEIASELALKAPIASPTFTGTVSGISKSMVGLGNVDNTSDAAKPISTLTQAALDLKAPLASPTFTGTVTLPNDTVAFAKMQNIATARILGRTTASSGDIEELNAAAVAALLTGGSDTHVQFRDGTVFGGQVGFEFDKTIGQLMLDNSGISAVELLVNGSFTGNASGWTLGTGWAYGSNKVTHTPGQTAVLSQTIAGLQEGRKYKLTFTVSDMTQGRLGVSLGGMTRWNRWEITANGTYNLYANLPRNDVTTPSIDPVVIFDPAVTNFGGLDEDPTGAFDGSVDTVSVVELPPAILSRQHVQVHGITGVELDTDQAGPIFLKGTVEGAGDILTEIAAYAWALSAAPPDTYGDAVEIQINNTREDDQNTGASLFISTSRDAISPAKVTYRVHGDGEDEAVVSLGFNGEIDRFGMSKDYGLSLDDEDQALWLVDPTTGGWEITGESLMLRKELVDSNVECSVENLATSAGENGVGLRLLSNGGAGNTGSSFLSLSVHNGDALEDGATLELDTNGVLTLDHETGVVFNATTPPTLANGRFTFTLDEANDQILVTVKYSDGTDKAGAIGLG